MTYAELQRRMSNVEFELWMALASVRGEECPSCGREAKDMMDYEVHEVKCPVCKAKFQKVRSVIGTHRSK